MQPSAASPVADLLRLVAAAALFSTGGAAIKATTLTAWQVASFRSGIAALAVLLLVPAARRGWSPRVVLVSIVYAATMTGGCLACDDEGLEARFFAPEAIPWEELAFRSTYEALREFLGQG